MVRLVRWFGANRGAQLVLGGVVAMLAFPATAAGTVGRLIALGALGIGVAWAWPTLPASVRSPSPRVALAIALGVVGAIGLATFWPVLAYTPSPDWQTGDWGPQHAVLANLMPHLPGFDVPVWNHAVSTGDAPLELYPALTYLVTGHLALLFGLEHDLPHAFMIVAALTHLGLALTTTAVAARIAPKPLAVIVGVFFLVDTGAISHGGTVGLFQWALLHSAFAHVWSMIAALGILAALARPRLGASVAIWVGTAVGTAAHPAALITSATFALALFAVAALAGDVTPRRALAALGHLAIGVALGAVVWLPAAERLLAYGQHFPNELFQAGHVLQLIMQHAMPMTAYSLFVYASYLGMLIGPWTRRAEVIFVSVVGLVFMLGLTDEIYLALGLTPGKTVARLGAIRMMLLVRPFVFAGAAFVIGALVAHVRAAWRTAPGRQRWVAAALLGIMLGTFARVVPEYYGSESDRAVGEANKFAPDSAGQRLLEAWAAREMEDMTPATWGRALVETTTHEHMHLTARTGLPTFHLSPIPDLLLRERIEDASPASLARFNVRWVIAAGGSPRLGDPATERRFGSYHVRELAEWDGKFARIERGTGTVEVSRIADDVVEIDVKADAPVLVALGTGYYPRWRAHHESGASEPVFALPSIEGSKLHVVSAWVAPGRTTFTCDGELPSDGDGRVLSLLAALLALAGVIAWRVPRWKWRALRRVAAGRAWVLARTGRVLDVAVPVVVAALLAFGFLAWRGPAGAVLVGSSGIRPSATVEARLGGDGAVWETCGFWAMTGTYRCDGLVSVTDTTLNLLNDAPPSWAFISPAITATPETPGIEVRITRRLRLGGTYWLGTNTGAATIKLDDEIAHGFGKRSGIEVPRGTYTVVLTAQLPDTAAQSIAVVQASTLVPARPFLAPPPDTAPASVTAIGR